MSTKSAVLVNLTIHSFVNELSDKKIAAEVAERYQAKTNAGRYLKVRLPPLVLKPIQRILDKTRQYHYKASAPWFDRGIRVLPGPLLVEYQNTITQFRGELGVEVSALCKQLPVIDAEARRLRGNLYSANIIPSAEELKRTWGIDVELLPVPMVEDFRIDFLENKFKKKFEASNKERFAGQSEHVRELLLTPLLRLEETWQKDKPRVRESTMENLAWVVKNASVLALDDQLRISLEKYADQVQKRILAFYNPGGRPSFDPEAIEDAMAVIARVKEDFQNA